MASHLIPPVTEFREHLVMVCLLLMSYESLRLREQVPDQGFNTFAPAGRCSAFSALIRKAHPDRNLPITEDDVLLTYAACHLTTLLLLSSYDQRIMDHLFRNTPDLQHLGPITHFRENMIGANTYICKDTEKKYRKFGALHTLKRKLQAVSVV